MNETLAPRADFLNRIAFARGWILSPVAERAKLTALPPYYVAERVTEFWDFFHDEILDFVVSRRGDECLIFIGLAYDIEAIGLETAGICAKLHNLFSFENTLSPPFLDALDNLAGRFALLCLKGETCFVFNDCGGLQPVFYHERENVLASHGGLINILFPGSVVHDFARYRETCRKLKIRPPKALPGDLTPWASIFILLPNNCLKLPEHELVRYFPRDSIRPVDFRETAIFIAEKLKALCERLNRDYTIYFSLTFGMDSRTSLSAVKNIRGDVAFFTYFYSGRKNAPFLKYDSRLNLTFARELVRFYGLDFRELDLSAFEVSAAIKAEFAKNWCLTHQLAEVLAYVDMAREKNPVHLRSNVYELLKFNRCDIPGNSSKESVARYLTQYNYVYEASPFRSEFIDYYLNTFIDKYDIATVLKSGYNCGDLFYMEHRNGQWLAAVLAETDAAVRTFIPVNCRKFIKLALSLPKRLKDKNVLQNLIIGHNWPELLDGFKYPNVPAKIRDLADYATYKDKQVAPLRDWESKKLNFIICSYNPGRSERRDFHYLKTNFASIETGFASIEMFKKDAIDIAFSFPVQPGKYYYLSFSIYTSPANLVANVIKYAIYINSKLKYSLGLDEFAGVNKFDYIFLNGKEKEADLLLRLSCEKDTLSASLNSLIRIENLIFRRETKILIKDRFAASLDGLKKRKWFL
ncbi:MAG: hypothetical protein K2H64_01085 [Desulfovibrio sp.]|nr:hypothetical protein [Desulfovibrio sp.]